MSLPARARVLLGDPVTPRLAADLTRVAVDLSGRVREDPADFLRARLAHLSHGNLVELALLLAGMNDVERPVSEVLDWVQPVSADEHGTERGWRRHRSDGQDPCERCEAAHREHEAKRLAKVHASRNRTLKACGSRRAYDRHKEAGEQPCVACDQANRDYYAEQKRKQRAKAAADQLAATAEQLLEQTYGDLAVQETPVRHLQAVA